MPSSQCVKQRCTEPIYDSDMCRRHYVEQYPHESTGSREARIIIRHMKLSQREIAKSIGFDVGRFNRIIKGGSRPTLDECSALSHALGVPLELWTSKYIVK